MTTTWMRGHDEGLVSYLRFYCPTIALRELGDWEPAHCYAVYRFFDRSGGLLYVGITKQSLRARLTDHRRRAWWQRVVRIELVYGYTETEARACELASIRGEQPLHNVAGATCDWPRKGGLAGGWQYA